MLLVGLTGGIGSGKSTVARMLARRGAVVQSVATRYAWLGHDRIASQVLGEGPPDLVVSFGTWQRFAITRP